MSEQGYPGAYMEVTEDTAEPSTYQDAANNNEQANGPDPVTTEQKKNLMQAAETIDSFQKAFNRGELDEDHWEKIVNLINDTLANNGEADPKFASQLVTSLQKLTSDINNASADVASSRISETIESFENKFAKLDSSLKKNLVRMVRLGMVALPTAFAAATSPYLIPLMFGLGLVGAKAHGKDAIAYQNFRQSQITSGANKFKKEIREEIIPKYKAQVSVLLQALATNEDPQKIVKAVTEMSESFEAIMANLAEAEGYKDAMKSEEGENNLDTGAAKNQVGQSFA